MFKRIKILFLILFLLFSTSSIGALISDNDSNSFVSKNEFENFKKDIKFKIDGYNGLIDSKIDNAIELYLNKMEIANTETLSSYLDKEGKYGGLVTYWCSGTDNVAYDRVSEKYSYENFTIGNVQQNYTASMTINNPELKSADSSKLCKFGTERDYLSSKKKEIELDDGNKVIGLQRVVFNTIIKWSITEMRQYKDSSQEPNSTTYDWTTNVPIKAIDNSSSSLVQNAANVQLAVKEGVLRSYDTPYVTGSYTIANSLGYYGLGTISINTNDVSDNYIIYDKVCPLSNAIDYYWDADDKTSIMTHLQPTNINSTNISNYTAGTVDGKNYNACFSVVKGNVFGSANEVSFGWRSYQPSIYMFHTVPWCSKSDKKAKDIYPVHWNYVNNKNRQVKNGIILTKTVAKGQLVVICEATLPGKLYLVASEMPIDNWVEGDFKGEVFEINEADTPISCVCNKKIYKDDLIWCIYLPNSTTNTDGAILKINEIYQTIERSNT